MGLCSGVVMYTGAQWAKKFGLIKGKALNPNTGMLVVLSSFAFGTFFMASTTGKELVHLLHPVFRAGWIEPPNDLALPKLDYGAKMQQSQQLRNNNNNQNEGSVDPQQLKEMRLARRTSVMETLLQRKGGISDSHSGRWVEEDDQKEAGIVDPKQLREMRLARRKSLMETLTERRGGLSDSHSGRWVESNSETKFEKEY